MNCGDTFGRYELTALIARGGMAEVWRARARGAGGFRKDVVIKTILPHLAQDPEFIEMFRNEALLAAGLNHPNLVQIFDFGSRESTYFIAMEFVDGQSLRHIARRYRQQTGAELPPWLALYVAAAVCDGLQYAHDLRGDDGRPIGLVHRDVSPENIMISYPGLVKLLDFGVAKATKDASLTDAGTLKGKYSYMAPEQILGRQVDRRIDVYGVGVILYELLTGVRPFQGRTQWDLLQQITSGEVAKPSSLMSWIPPELDRILLRAIERDPGERFGSTQELQAQLSDYLEKANNQRSQRDVGQFMQELYTEEVKVRTPAPKKAQAIAEVVAQVETKNQGPDMAALVAELRAIETPAPMKDSDETQEGQQAQIEDDDEEEEEEGPAKEETGSSSVRAARSNPWPRKEEAEGSEPSKSLAEGWATVVERSEEKTGRRRPRPATGRFDRRRDLRPVQAVWPASARDRKASEPKEVEKDAQMRSKPPSPEEGLALQHFEKGLSLVRQGRPEEAVGEWEAAVKLDPKSRTYQFNLERLQKKLS